MVEVWIIHQMTEVKGILAWFVRTVDTEEHSKSVALGLQTLISSTSVLTIFFNEEISFLLRPCSLLAQQFACEYFSVSSNWIEDTYGYSQYFLYLLQVSHFGWSFSGGMSYRLVKIRCNTEWVWTYWWATKWFVSGWIWWLGWGTGRCRRTTGKGLAKRIFQSAWVHFWMRNYHLRPPIPVLASFENTRWQDHLDAALKEEHDMLRQLMYWEKRVDFLVSLLNHSAEIEAVMSYHLNTNRTSGPVDPQKFRHVPACSQEKLEWWTWSQGSERETASTRNTVAKEDSKSL